MKLTLADRFYDNDDDIDYDEYMNSREIGEKILCLKMIDSPYHKYTHIHNY